MSQEEATDLSREGHSLYSMWEDNRKARRRSLKGTGRGMGRIRG
jgi:hypothetical protein